MAYLASQPYQLGEEISGSQLFQRLAKQFQLPRLKNEEVEKDQYCRISSDFGSVVKSVAVKNDRSPCVNWTERRAAVLICLFEGEEGDVALPGGKFEKGDADDSATALREAMEEIGLEPNLVRVAATLEPFISQHLLKVVPVVGLLARKGDFRPSLNTDEVDAIFDVPLEMFLKGDNHRCEAREWMGRKYILHLFDFQCEKGVFLIWGLTANILIRAASIIYQRSPCFEAHLPDFQTIACKLCST
ncbi:hypothetical protein I3843_09G209700 [Carya illinoinensis]|nr:hypothetical protein I3843_09G209700 [Carya illinoinensis]